MTTPTNDSGNPTAATAPSIAGVSTLARPTTATSAISSKPRLASAARLLGGSACSSSSTTSPADVSGRKKSRCLNVWVMTNTAYSTSDAIAANASWAGVNSGPGRLIENVGSTKLKVANVITVASAAPDPSALKTVMWKRTAPISSATPTMPLQVIITAANTVSRASAAVPGPPEIISVTISPTSMIVTAIANTSDP